MITEIEEGLLGEFMANARIGRNISMKLLHNFKERMIITDETTLFKLNSDPEYVQFREALFNSMSLYVGKTVEDSIYGMGLFSDFDVLHSFGTESNRTTFIRANPAICNSMSVQQMQEIKLNSTILRRWVHAQRKALIGHWNLPDGDYAPRKSEKRPRSVPTPASIANRAEKGLTNTSNSQAKIQFTNFQAGIIFLFTF